MDFSDENAEKSLEECLEVQKWIPKDYQTGFPFDMFNRMQSRVIPVISETYEDILVTAPTASGKTVIAEVAIVHEVKKRAGKTLFIAPLRALTYEKLRAWKTRFPNLNIEALTGEIKIDVEQLEQADVIVTTPEKWDSITRKWERYQKIIFETNNIIIDEVHLLDAPGRGSALECLVARLRRLFAEKISKIRFIALSATLPNYLEVAAWLGVEKKNIFIFDESYRPTKLETSVIPHEESLDSIFEQESRTRLAGDLIESHLLDGGQVLIFVASRQGTQHGARSLVSYWDQEGKFGDFSSNAAKVNSQKAKDSNLSDLLALSVGFHHAGLSREDRELVEDGFRTGIIRVLFSTSTLAWGINLPARAVVIRDSSVHDPLLGTVEISPLDLLQMLGRAGRPQYDPVGFGYVIVPSWKQKMYTELLKHGRTIESHLPKDLIEHLNAEIVLRTITSVTSGLDWIKTTYYYYRGKQRIGEELCLEKATQLVKVNLSRLQEMKIIEGSKDLQHIIPTKLGEIAAIFYIKIEDVRKFDETIRKGIVKSVKDAVRLVAQSEEFRGVVVRRSDSPFILSFDEISQLSSKSEKKIGFILWTLLIGQNVPKRMLSETLAIRETSMRLFAALAEIATLHSASCYRQIVMAQEALENQVSFELVGLLGKGLSRKTARNLGRSGYGTLKSLRELDCDSLKSELSEKEVELLKKYLHKKIVTVEWRRAPINLKIGTTADFSLEIRNEGSSRAALTLSLSLNETHLFKDQLELHPDEIWSFPLTVNATNSGDVTYSVIIENVLKENEIISSQHTVKINNE
ncbi:MAG: DEAD/DEAH box helicase [Promethearchaeota archaeon]